MAESKTDLLVKEIMNFNIGENKGFYTYYQPAKKDLPEKINDILLRVGGKPKIQGLEDFNISKSKKGAIPEYIITFDGYPDLILIIENKSNIKKHESKNLDRPQAYAVDGVLFYAKYFKEEYNVIALAVSGEEKEDLTVSTYLWHRGSAKYDDKGIATLLNDVNGYIGVYKNNIKIDYKIEDIRKIAQDLHNDLRDLGYSEKEKPLFVAGIVIALSNEESGFSGIYEGLKKSKAITDNLCNSIKNYIYKFQEIDKNRTESMFNEFKKVFSNQKLNSKNINDKSSILKIINVIKNSILPMMDKSHDVIGEFYNEFIRYSGGDGKGLGIVLTPAHITELFCDLVDLTKHSKVLDICCGTGSFLVSAFHRMLKKANRDEDRENIKMSGIHGVEINMELFTLAYSNMIVRKDGKSNIINDDCFSKAVTEKLKDICDVGMINPPYSQKTPEIVFINRMLDLLEKSGIGVAIVPMSVAIGTKNVEERKKIMSKHRLLAVMSMPDDLFYPTGVNTCIMVWKAHEPHNSQKYKTWFGYWKDDGFIKKKKHGRIDFYGKWEDLKGKYLKMYRNKEIVDGLSAYEYVGYSDEWLCEAYMKTDYSNLNKNEFEKTIRDYLAYLIKIGDENA